MNDRRSLSPSIRAHATGGGAFVGSAPRAAGTRRRAVSWRRYALPALILAIGAAVPAAWAQDPRASALDQRLVCESRDGREQYCAAQIAGSVRVLRELSRAPCVEGDSWRWNPRGIYVRNGCRAEFAFRGQDDWGGGGWGGGGSGGARYTEIVCASRGSRENFCAAPNDGRVRLVREQGSGQCIEGQSWRADPQGIRVRGGCVGRFGYFRISGDDGWGGGGGWGPPPAESFEVRCESRSHRWRTCPVDIVGPVQLVRQDSHAPCVRGWTWGTIAREAIWVSDGCRGRFIVNGRTSVRSSAEGPGGAPPGVRRSSPPPGVVPPGQPTPAEPATPEPAPDGRYRGIVPRNEGQNPEP
jgi:hypothetical protein